MTKRILALLLALTFAIGLAACGNSSAPAPANTPASAAPAAQPAAPAADAPKAETGGPKYGGEVTLYYPKFYNYFDPAMMDEYQFSFWFETLWVMDWGLNDPETYAFPGGDPPMKFLGGQLADTWSFDQSTGVFVVELVKGALFHEGAPYNGRELKASDVVWSYSRLLGINDIPKVDSEIDWASYLTMVEGIKATGDYTVEFTFKEGSRTEIALGQLMNAKVNIAGAEWDSSAKDWTCAKGTGPYVLEEYIPDNSMKFVKNEKYYGFDERYPENRLPYIDTVNLVYIADSSNILVQSMSGSLDWFGENGKDVLNSSELAQLNAAGAGTLYSYMSSSPSGIGFKVNQEPFKDIRVRIALQKAIDIEAIDSQYFGNPEDIVIPGLWSPSLSEWSTAGSWNADLLDEFKYDPEASKALLVEAGYPDGFEFTLQCDPLVDLDLYTLAADYLQTVGVKMNIETAPEMMEAVQVSQDADDPRQFNAFAGGFGDYMLASFMTGDGPIPNSYKHDDQAYKDRLASMSQASTEDERSAIARELDQNFPAAHWCVFLSGMQPSFDFMSKRIGGYAGEKVYFRQNMRTVWSRLWIES